MVELDVPGMIHVSRACNPAFHTTGSHYLNGDTTAFMQLLQGDLFRDFPTLKLIIPHGGGAVPYHWGRFRGLAQVLKRPELTEYLMHNVFFDTCVYHLPGQELLTKVVPAANILFASEMIGAVPGMDWTPASISTTRNGISISWRWRRTSRPRSMKAMRSRLRTAGEAIGEAVRVEPARIRVIPATTAGATRARGRYAA